MDALERLEDALAYRFKSRELLSQALTHASRKNDLQFCNERMEFLGDAILGAVVSEFLFRSFPDYTEGDLTRVKSVVVSRPTLVRLAKKLRLEEYLDVGKGVTMAPPRPAHEKRAAGEEQTAASRRALPQSLLSDAFEAIIAAIYLDGGIRPARKFIMRHVRAEVERACERAHAHNHKSALQHLTQREMGTTPSYRVAAEDGPDHGKMFEVVTVINGKDYGVGRGTTKKAAEQMAARETLKMLDRGEGTRQ